MFAKIAPGRPPFVDAEAQKCTATEALSLLPRFHSTNGRAARSAGLIHPSIVNSRAARKFMSGEALIFTKSFTPSKRKACPTSPSANEAPLFRVPLLVRTASKAFPSPGHQETSPKGAPWHGSTLSVATMLVTEPKALLTTTV